MSPFCISQIKIPATQAVIIIASVPPIMARMPRMANSARRSGAMPQSQE